MNPLTRFIHKGLLGAALLTTLIMTHAAESLTVEPGATVSGTGTVDAPVTVKGKLAPGLIKNASSGNPVFPGWYADPEGAIFGNQYWIYPTYSEPYDDQTHFDAFSSRDLITWTAHPNILDTTRVTWAKRAMWAPSIIAKDGKYYFFFSANDIQNDTEPGGIGVAVADSPGGPYSDYIGAPLVSKYYNGAQPIDCFVYLNDDGKYYLIYGGHSHCNIAQLTPDFKGFVPFSDGTTFKEITPSGYVEGPFMLKRNGKYYFMWSEGNWTASNYRVAYAMSDSVTGPFTRLATLLQTDPAVATGPGHHSVIHNPNSDRYYMVYHRHPLGETDGNHRVTCIDLMEFNADGTIKTVTITKDGLPPDLLPGN